MIAFDRLVFDIPGLTPERAKRLAHSLGAIAAAQTPGQPGAAADAAPLDVLLPSGRAASDEAILAAFAAALRTRMG